MSTNVEKKVKVGIIGSGVVGSVIGAHLAAGGHETYMVDRESQVVDGIKNAQNNIKVTYPQGSKMVCGQVTDVFTDIANLAKLDLDYVFICVKAYDLESLRGYKFSNKEDVCLISFQNGIGTENIIAQFFPRKRVFRGVVNYAGVSQSPGVIKMTFFHPPNYIGCFPGGEKDRAVNIANLLEAKGLGTEFTDDIKKEVWKKAILNAVLMPVAVLTGLSMERIMLLEETRFLVEKLFREFIPVAEAEGIKFVEDFRAKALDYLSDSGDHVPSMLADFLAGRRLELDFLNRKLQTYADEHQIRCDTNRIMLHLIEGLLHKRDFATKSDRGTPSLSGSSCPPHKP